MRALRMTPSVNCGLWLIVVCVIPQFCHTGMVILVGTGSVGISVLSVQFNCKAKTGLKIILLINF